MHIPVPNAILENKAERVALPNEIYEHMYCVSGTDFLFLHNTYLHAYTYIYTYTVSVNICLNYVCVPCINTCRALFSIPEMDMDAV